MRKWLLFDVISQYNVLPNFTAAVARALREKGYETTVVPPADAEKVFSELSETKVDVVFGFNGVQNVVVDGLDIHDRFGVLSVAWLVDDPRYHWIRFVNPQSPQFYMGCIDRKHVEEARARGVNAVFLPHGAEPEYLTDPARARSVDVFVSGSFHHPTSVLRRAQETMPPAITPIFRDMIDSFDYTVSFEDALRTVLVARKLDRLDATYQQNLTTYLWPFVDTYLRNKARLRALWALPRDARIVISGKGDWDMVVERFPNALLLPPLDFKDTLAVMKQSKVVLNITPSLVDGGHERIFYGMITGSVVLTNPTPFLMESFRDGESILFLGEDPRCDVERLQSYLQDKPKLLAIAEAGQQLVRQEHTWSHRVDSLLRHLAMSANYH